MSATNNQKVLRLLYSQQKTALCSAIELLEDPEKSQFKSLLPGYDEVLAVLPDDETKPADEKLVNSLTSSNSLINSLLSVLNGLKQKLAIKTAASASAATPEQVEAALTAKVNAGELIMATALNSRILSAIGEKTRAGELVAKETVTQLCSEAETNGAAKGEKKVRDEIAVVAAAAKKIGERKTLLASANLPCPEAAIEAILAGTDEEFSAAKTKTEGRLADLKTKGIALNSKSPLLAKVWLPDDQYNSFVLLAQETLGGARHNPFATGDKGDKPVSIGCV